MEGRKRHYSILIEYEPTDNIYIASVPELPGCETHGLSYEEALAQVQDALDGFVAVAEAEHLTLPAPRFFDLSEAPTPVQP